MSEGLRIVGKVWRRNGALVGWVVVGNERVPITLEDNTNKRPAKGDADVLILAHRDDQPERPA